MHSLATSQYMHGVAELESLEKLVSPASCSDNTQAQLLLCTLFDSVVPSPMLSTHVGRFFRSDWTRDSCTGDQLLGQWTFHYLPPNMNIKYFIY